VSRLEAVDWPTDPHDRPVVMSSITVIGIRGGGVESEVRTVEFARPGPLVLLMKVGWRPNVVLGSGVR
jgi:hypothetical protein